jgi:hypothetical protein
MSRNASTPSLRNGCESVSFKVPNQTNRNSTLRDAGDRKQIILRSNRELAGTTGQIKSYPGLDIFSGSLEDRGAAISPL